MGIVDNILDNLADGITKVAQAAIAAIETSIDAAPGSLLALKDADDWSFVIKAHALLEGAASLLSSTSACGQSSADLSSVESTQVN
jgi:hypothetical protein